MRTNLLNNNASRLTWGTGALASNVTLAPGQKVESPFHPGLVLPQPRSRARPVGHMYANWFNDAAEVNKFLSANYAAHREGDREIRARPGRHVAGRAARLRLVEPVGHAGQEHLVDQGRALRDLGRAGLLRPEHDGRGLSTAALRSSRCSPN